MLHFLPGPIIGCLAFILYIANTILWLIPILIFSLLKALVPLSLWQKFFSYLLDQMASNWVLLNTWNQKLFTKTTTQRHRFRKTKNERLVLSDQ